jgi:putative adenylate-forming enzyme
MSQNLLINYFYFNAKLMKYRFNSLSFRKWQDQRAKERVRFASLRSPFYHQFYKGFDTTIWKELPTIDKNILMANFDKLNTRGIQKDEALVSTFVAGKAQHFKTKYQDISVQLTSGTSGQQGIFLMSSFEESRWVATFLARAVPFNLRYHRKIALFMRPNRILAEALKIKDLNYKYYDLIKPVADQIIDLDKFYPTLLVAPPSVLRVIAQMKKEMRLRLRPTKIFCIGEVLEPIDQDFIEMVFEQNLHQIYQAAEGFFGITCEHNTLHLNEDLMVFQEEDLGQGRFQPIITDLYRETQPLIRYRLDDVLIRGENRCACGSYFRTIEKVECRRADVFLFLDQMKNQKITVFPDLIRDVLMQVSDQIDEYHITQEYAHQLAIQVKPKEDIEIEFLELRIQRGFAELFRKMNIAPVEVEISFGRHKILPFTKMKRVERDIEL